MATASPRVIKTPRRTVSLEQPFFRQVIQLSRPFNALSPLLAVCIGFILAGGSLLAVNISFVWLIVAMVFVHSGITLANDIVDIDIDRSNHVWSPLTKGSKAVINRFSLIAVLLMTSGLLIALIFTPFLSLLGITAMLVLGLLYNHLPLRLSTRPIGSIVVLAVSYGLLPGYIGYSVLAILPTAALVSFLFFYTLARVALSMLKDFKDIDGDSTHGKRTFLIRFGEKTTLRISNILSVIGLIGVTALTIAVRAHQSIIGAVVSAFLLSTILGVILLFRFAPQYLVAGTMSTVFDKLMILQLLFDGGVLVCLLW